MNKIAIVSLSALGGTVLFAVSFLGFAKLNGVPPHTLPVLGGMFPTPPDDPHAAPPALPEPVHPEATQADPAGEPVDAEPAPGTAPHAEPSEPQVAESEPPAPRPRELRAGFVDLVDVDGLYTQQELRALGDSLRAKNREADQRGFELDRREDLLADRLVAHDERRRALEEFARQLDARERELSAREAELRRDVDSAQPAKPVAPADMAPFFADGDNDVLVKRLSGFSPEEAAAILAHLDPQRAKELLDALPPAQWRDFAEAYARVAAPKPTQD